MHVKLPSSSLFATLSLLVLLAPAISNAAESAPDGNAANSDAGTWITLGADAFDMLQGANLSFQGEPLKAEAQLDTVVLTRVSQNDIEHISVEIHEELKRCPGFLAHASREKGLQALRKADTGYRGTPITYVIDQAATVQNLESRIDKAEILATIQHLSTEYNNRYYQHPSGTEAATWIRDRWQTLAGTRSDVTAELYDHSGWAQSSVVLTIEGSSLPDEVVVLGGHLDSVSSGSGNPNFLAPGADDNASGIAVLTEVIRVAMAAGFQPQRTIKIMGYAAEEAGLLGSQEIAGDFQSSGVNVVAVLQLDMTNYNGSTQDMAFLSDFTNNPLTLFAKSLIDTYQPDLEWTNTACGYGCSDHASWHREGYPAVMPSEAIFGQHNPWIHSPSDTIGALGDNADHAFKFARFATALMVEIGLVQNGEIFVDGFDSGDLTGWDSSFR